MYQLYSTHKASHKCLKRKKEIAESSIAVGEEGQSLQEKKKGGALQNGSDSSGALPCRVDRGPVPRPSLFLLDTWLSTKSFHLLV